MFPPTQDLHRPSPALHFIAVMLLAVILLSSQVHAGPHTDSELADINEHLKDLPKCFKDCYKGFPKGDFKTVPDAIAACTAWSTPSAQEQILACINVSASCQVSTAPLLASIESDCEYLTPTLGTNSPVNTIVPTSASPGTNAGSAAGSAQGGGSGSNGTITAVAVTLVLLVAATAAIIGVLYWRKRRRESTGGAAAPNNGNGTFDVKQAFSFFSNSARRAPADRQSSITKPPATPPFEALKNSQTSNPETLDSESPWRTVTAASAAAAAAALHADEKPGNLFASIGTSQSTIAPSEGSSSSFPIETQGNLFPAPSEAQLSEKSLFAGERTGSSSRPTSEPVPPLEKAVEFAAFASGQQPAVEKSRVFGGPSRMASFLGKGGEAEAGGHLLASRRAGKGEESRYDFTIPTGMEMKAGPSMANTGRVSGEGLKTLPSVPLASVMAPAVQPEAIPTWTTVQVSEWLHSIGMKDEIVENLKVRNLDGPQLLALTDGQLIEMGVDQPGIRQTILYNVKAITGVGDPIMDAIDVPPPYMGA
ncbi:hypothetical protein HDU67_002700 [Dinochytrium kinnereticum]|nr:hypothetical protein HDU67_002700 [Dinochytrium kinnereticum]